MNYYRRYIGDYRRDTGTLTLLEHGVYTVLLDEYYAQRGVLPLHQSELCILCHATSKLEREAVNKVSHRFFPANGAGVRHNKRADEELDIAKAAIEKMSAAGKKSAAKRWGKL